MSRPLARLVIALVALIALPASAAAQRLPRTVVPEHYRLHFTPDLSKETFSGTAGIDVQLSEPSGVIVLNAVDLAISQARVLQGGRRRAARVELDSASEQARLVLDKPLGAGRARLELRFSGALGRRLSGFYISTTPTRKYAFTQLWATDARRMFPCFDEPALKATFELSVTIRNGDTAISNGAPRADTAGPGRGVHTVHFAPTPTMSTYLVALAVGDFACTSGSAGAVPVRVCTTPGKAALTSFALEAAEASLAFYDRYYGIPYPFGKLDLIAVPDFWVGAMENSGAVMFREATLLVDPATASDGAKRHVAEIIAHEIAHQWFGNLVTAHWWNDAWLSEGFATWMAPKPIAAWKPDWPSDEREVYETIAALEHDSLPTARAIRTDTENPAEIPQLFDAVIYDKAASVLRMLERYVGPDAFRLGIQAFLARYAYGTATAEDFARAMAEATGKPVVEILDGFVNRPGAPRVDVELRCNDGRGVIALTQGAMAGPDGAPWSFPVCIRSEGRDAPQCDLLTDRRQERALDTCPAWILANAGATGYYRSRYSAATLPDLARHASQLTQVERALLVADSWAAVRDGALPATAYLDLVPFVVTALDAPLTNQVAGPLALVHASLLAPGDRPVFERWLSTVLQPALTDLGLEAAPSESPERRALRAALADLAARTAGMESVRTRLRDLAAAYLDGTVQAPDPELLEVSLHALAEGGTTADYERVLRAEHAAGQSVERLRLMRTRARFRDPSLLVRTLGDLLGPAVRSQDAPWLLLEAAGDPRSQQAVWTFVREHFDAIRAKFGSGQGAPLAKLPGLVCEEDLLADIDGFLSAQRLPGLDRPLAEAREQARSCIRLREREQDALHRWLLER